MNESRLRFIIREELYEIAGAPAGTSGQYDDGSGYKFQIQGGKLMLVKRPPGATGKKQLPLQLTGQMLQKTLTNLSKRYPNDQQLKSLSQGAPQTPISPVSPGLTLGKKTGQLYPVTAADLNSHADFIHSTPAGVDDCSAWAKGFVGYQGNAWIANRTGSLKFNAFENLAAYKAAATKLFKEMNAVHGLSPTSTKSFNPRVKAIVQTILPSPMSLASSMQIGDVVGMYFVGSGHHAEAFFESCSGWSLTSKSQTVSTCVATADGRPWSSSMIGQNLNFAITRPFAMNTHLGFVGGMINGEPIIFHNMMGKVHINPLSKITNAKCYPVWIKQGNYAAATAPTSSGDAGGGGVDLGGMWDRIKGAFSE